MRKRPDLLNQSQILDPIWIPLSDGTRLAARIMLPSSASENAVPAVLEYLPYRRSDGTFRRDAVRHPYLAAHGIAAVRVDMRGSGDSEGILADEYLPIEQIDACEVIAWIAAQHWCNGNVGMFGISWGGFNALQVAARRPPALKAIITVCSTDDRYADDVHYMGGCLLAVDMLPWASVMLAFNARPPDPAVVGPHWRESWLSRIEETPRYSEIWLAHQRRDAYWQQGSVCEDYSGIQCPVYAVGGWADGYTNAVFRLIAGLTAPRKGLVGPWAHKYPEAGVPGPAIGFQDEAIRWWKHWLNGEQTGIMDEPMLTSYLQDAVQPASWYAQRPGRWTADLAWPAQSVNEQMWCMGQLGLTAAPQAGHTYTIGTDLRHGADAGMWCSYAVPGDYPPDQRGEDGRSLTFDTAPVTRAVDILGFPRVTLRMTANQATAMVVVRLCDIAPDGTSLLVSRGMLNLTHRDGHDTVTTLIPGEYIDVALTLNAAGHTLQPGHAWRIAIAPSYWPHAWPSAHLVTLELDSSGCHVLLPVRTAQAEDAGAGMFEEPAGTPERGIDELRPDARRRYERYDQVSMMWELHDENDHGAFMRPDGLTYGHRSADRYFIVTNNPCSARSVCEHEITVGRGDWQTRVVTWSELRCDSLWFYIDNRITAYEGKDVVATQSHQHRVARDGI